MRCLLLSVLLSLCCALPAAALELTAISPSTVFPGTSVTLAGGPFVDGVTVLVGSYRVRVDDFSAGRVTFTVPALTSGEYTLAVEQGGVRSGRNFVLRVVQPPPRIRSLDPTTLDACAGDGNRQVAVRGSNFQPGAELLFDTATLAVDRRDASEIVFTLPPVVKSGLHQVQVVNPDNQRSLPHSLIVNNTPEITDIQVGEERTVEYELLVRGKNFVNNSQVLLNGSSPVRDDSDPPQIGIRRDTVRFVDCATLIYVRRPLIRDARELTLQVSNPGGEQSNAYSITAP